MSWSKTLSLSQGARWLNILPKVSPSLEHNHVVCLAVDQTLVWKWTVIQKCSAGMMVGLRDILRFSFCSSESNPISHHQPMMAECWPVRVKARTRFDGITLHATYLQYSPARYLPSPSRVFPFNCTDKKWRSRSREDVLHLYGTGLINFVWINSDEE